MRQHKGFSVTNIDVKWRHISAGTAVEAETVKTQRATISFPTTIYKQHMSSAVVWVGLYSITLYTLLSVSSVLLTESRGHVYPFIQVGQGSLISWRAVCLWSLHICYSQCLNVGFLINCFWNGTYIYYLVHWDLLENQEMTNCSVHIKQNQLFHCS